MSIKKPGGIVIYAPKVQTRSIDPFISLRLEIVHTYLMPTFCPYQTLSRSGTENTFCKVMDIRGQAPVSEGGIDFEGPWRDLGGEPKESPSLRGGIRKFDQF